MADAQDHEHDHEHSEQSRIEALRDQGVHRAGEHEGPFSLHVVGIGRAGASTIAQLLRDRPKGFLDDPTTRFSALAVDIGDQDLQQVRDAASGLPSERSQVRTVALPVPTAEGLMTSLNRYREFLKMEYPRYYWNPNYEPWLPGDLDIPEAGQHFPRAVAKAIYGAEYYQDGEIAQALDDFAGSVMRSESTPIVAVVFSLAGGTGSGIVVELARHLSSIKLGRRPWVVGIGVLPCDGDPDELRDGRLFPVINELDCMIDAEKNKGVMAVWGDLYKNPFTGGFFVVPQNDIFALAKDMTTTHQYVNEGVASFLARDNSVHLYETLKALNWLGVSAATWHPAIRGEMTDRWVNVLTVRKPDDIGNLGSLGLKSGFSTEFIEARAFVPDQVFGSGLEKTILSEVGAVASTAVEPNMLHVDADDHQFVSVCIPRASKLDLADFISTRNAYDKLSWDDKLLRHSWLLDLGVMLCEPSIRFDGMGGECIWGCACWVVVPHAAIRGEVAEQPTAGVS